MPNTDPPGHLVASGAAAAPVAPQAAAGTTAAQPASAAQSCPMAGCDHSVPAHVSNRHKWALGHGAHQRKDHKGQGEAYRQAAQQVPGVHPWTERLSLCPHCSNLHPSGTLNKHAKRCSQKPCREGAAGQTPTSVHQPDGTPEIPTDAPVYKWGLASGTAARVCLDKLDTRNILKIVLPVSKRLKRQFAPQFSRALVHALAGLRESTAAADPLLGDAWAKLWHLVPALLLVPDGRPSRATRFRLFETGHIAYLVQVTLDFAVQRMSKEHVHADTDSDLSAAADRARKQGLSRVARQLMEEEVQFAPRDQSTLDKLAAKHPAGDDADALRQAQTAGYVAAQAAEPNPQHNEVFQSSKLRKSIMAADKGSVAGLSGLSYEHLQTCMRQADGDSRKRLLDHLGWLGKQLFDHPQTLPPAFRSTYTAARLSGIGVKVRPIACGDTLRRLFTGMWCRHHKPRIAAMLAPLGQYGCCVTGGTDIVSTTAQLLCDSGGLVLTVDGTNAFNSLSRAAILTAVAERLPGLYSYVVMLYGADSIPDLVFALAGQKQAAVIQSLQGIQQGDPLGPLLWAITLLAVAVSFKERFPKLALPSYLDDTYICSTGTDSPVCETKMVLEAFDWLSEQLNLRNVAVNPPKSVFVLPQDPERAAEVRQCLQVAAGQRAEGRTPEAVEAAVVVGTPVGARDKVQELTTAMLQCPKLLKLLRGIVGMKQVDAQVSFALLRSCFSSRVTHLVRSVPTVLIWDSLRRLDALCMGALAAVLQEPSVTESGPDSRSDWERTVESILHPDWDASAHVGFSEHAQQQIRLRSRDGGLGLTSLAQHASAAFLGRTSQCLGPVSRGLSLEVRQALSDAGALSSSSLVAGMQEAAASLLEVGVPEARLQELLPEAYVQACSGDASALSELLFQASAENGAEEEEAVPPHLQAKLSDALHAVRKTSLIASLAAPALTEEQEADRLIAMARFNSERGKGAMAVFQVRPSKEPALTMRADLFRETGRRMLGVDKPETRGICGAGSCDQDMTAQHSYTCNKNAQFTQRHDSVVRMLKTSVLQGDMGLRDVQHETTACFKPQYSQERMDLVIPPHQLLSKMMLAEGREVPSHKALMLDFTHCSITGRDGRVYSAQHKTGAAAEKLAAGKQTKYQGHYYPDSFHLIPLAVEFFGATAVQTQEAFACFARHMSVKSEGAWTVSQCLARIRQKVSVAFHSAISESTTRQFAQCTPRGAEATRPLDYLYVRLLVPP
jgi:hypothetical protein